MDNKEIDYKRAAEQLRNGEPLFGKEGALGSVLKPSCKPILLSA